MSAASNPTDSASLETTTSLYPEIHETDPLTHDNPLGLNPSGATRTVTQLSPQEQQIIYDEARVEKTKNLLIAATINLIAVAILMHFVATGVLTFIGVIIVELIAGIFVMQKLDVLDQKIDLERDRLLNPQTATV